MVLIRPMAWLAREQTHLQKHQAIMSIVHISPKSAACCSTTFYCLNHGNRIIRKCGISSSPSSSSDAQDVYEIAAAEDGARKPTTRKQGMLQKLQSAFEKIYQRRISPHNSVRSESDIAGVVEQRIFHSMLEGDFENLPGKGKPLHIENNPHVDPNEEALYRVLAKNGFAPEWIELRKEIKFKLHRWRLALRFAWKQRFDNCAVNDHESEKKWTAGLAYLQMELEEINRKVLSYNLQAPFGHQICGYKIEKEVQLIENEHKRGLLESLPKQVS